MQVELLLLQLLLKQGMEHDRRSPGLLEPPQVGRIFTQGSGGPHHQRAAQG